VIQFYTPNQISNLLKVNTLTIYSYIRKGKLEAIKLGRHYRISQQGLDRFLETSKVKNRYAKAK